MHVFRLATLTLGIAVACGQPGEKSPPPSPSPSPSPSPTPSPDPDPRPDPIPKPAPAAKCGVCSIATDDELRAHHRKVTGVPLDDHCIRRVAAGPFKGAVVIGAFAHDRGCIPVGVHGNCCYHGDVRKAAAPLLAAAGWGAADAAHRAELALAYTDDVINAFDGRFLREPPDDWAAAKKPVVAPAATPVDGGAFTVRGWVRDPPGMINETRYDLVEHRYDASGNHVSASRPDTVVTR